MATNAPGQPADVRVDDDLVVERDPLHLVYRATRELLYSGEANDPAGVVCGLVRDLGGDVVPFDPAAGQAMIPLDIEGVVGVAATSADPEAARVLAEYLPAVLADARASQRLVRLAQAAHLDALTGLGNRRAMERLVPRLRSGDAVAVIDLDDFKSVNDNYGHAAGDAVLAAFGKLMRESSRPVDVYLRIGGDEFLAVYHRQPAADVLPVLTRLRAQWREVAPYPCTFTAGVAAVTDNDGWVACQLADARNLAGKRGGRDRITVD